MAGDSNFDKTVLLMHMDGVNNSTIFLDTSIKNQKIVTLGSSKISTVQSKFGGASASFDGTVGYLSCGSLDFSFDTNPFTIECWVYINGGTYNAIIDTRTAGAFQPYLFGVWNTAAGVYNLDFVYGAARLTGSTNISINIWHHIAIVRDTAGLLKFYIDGIADANTVTYATAINATTVLARLGSYVDPGYSNCYIDDLRISKIARYTANFTPPTVAFLDYAGQISGTITESLPITDWTITATKCSTGEKVGIVLVTGTTYTINITTLEPVNLTIAPKIDGAWKASISITLNYYVVAVNPDGTPHIWKCTTIGTTGTTEPIWNLTGTTSDNTVVWTYIAPLTDPITIGPKVAV